MTTKFLDDIICTFKILLSWRFTRKTALLDNYPLDPNAQPPSKVQILFFVVISQSLSFQQKTPFSTKTPFRQPMVQFACECWHEIHQSATNVSTAPAQKILRDFFFAQKI